MKHVLVIGGAGYIASHTVKLLHNNGYTVIIFDNLSTGFKKLAKYGELIVGDLANHDDLDKVFQKYKIDTVFHFAAFAYIGESVVAPQKYYKNNVSNTINLLEVMLKHNIKKIIFSSTCAVFGIPQYLPIDEKHPKNPINPYGRTKLMIEQIMQDYDSAYGLKYIILRYFNAGGADKDLELGEMHNPETHLIPLAIDALYTQKELKVFGDDYETKDGTCIRDYVHVEDLAFAHLKAYNYLNENLSSNIFNLGTKTGYSIMEIINSIENIGSKKLNFTIKKRRVGDPHTLIASYSKAKDILGWEPAYSDIDTIIRSAIGWYKKSTASSNTNHC